MNFKTLDDFNLKGKCVLLRIDLNSEIINGRVILNDRIIESAKTISELKKKKAKVVVLAHQGSPGDKNFINLKRHFKLLNKYVKTKFVPDILGKKALEEIVNLKDGEALLLDNIRFVKDEFFPEKKDNKLIKVLIPLFDIYVNDAFSVSHRAQTSIVGFPKFLPSGIGRNFEREIKSLKRLDVKDALFILGGAKIEDLISLLKKGRRILATGMFGLYCLTAKGYDIGVQRKKVLKNKKFLKKIKKFVKTIEMPIDFGIEKNEKRENLLLEELPSKYYIYDIGENTIEIYKKEIKEAKTVFMKGPAGICEMKDFSRGTEELMSTIANSNAFSIIGGGHTVSALQRFKLKKDEFNYVSLAGGALVKYLAGEKLLGLEALKKSKNR